MCNYCVLLRDISCSVSSCSWGLRLRGFYNPIIGMAPGSGCTQALFFNQIETSEGIDRIDLPPLSLLKSRMYRMYVNRDRTGPMR